MRLYNTSTKSIDNFTPIDSKAVRVYTCGPTVYNHAHIGNLSAYIYSDILHRALRSAGHEVQRVMNFTDVDDKTVRDSQVAFPDLPPMEALTKFTRKYEKIFLREMEEVGNDTKSILFERATENINEMQELILRLLRSKTAYVSDDGIYFSISEYSKTRKYGQLSKVDTPSQSRARIDNDEYDKDSAQDFALWKIEKPGEPAWDFEIDGQNHRGRPGWHIECSAMSVKKLGQPFDIHTGGIDLVFPHHENEIAQSTAGNQPEVMAKFFVHSEHLLVDGKKMAKSEHNFYTVLDIEAKGFGPLDFRMLALQSHYRSATNFSWDNLTAAQNRRHSWRSIAELRWQVEDSGDDGQTEIINNLLDQATTALTNDLDTPNVLRLLDQVIDVFAADSTNINHFALQNFTDFVDKNLGLRLADTTPDITNEQRNLIEKRTKSRAEKDWGKSDELRNQLAEQGIELNDMANRTIWSRK
ncbi:MAG: cysteine--tRNA ligase [Candidatus Nomurabacteria bacterium]|jgi:cysteinyl-tRNA synthetase|nr:cysteine--tRNA ligase [Candidatus Nomurabacteria bacterium]